MHHLVIQSLFRSILKAKHPPLPRRALHFEGKQKWNQSHPVAKALRTDVTSLISTAKWSCAVQVVVHRSFGPQRNLANSHRKLQKERRPLCLFIEYKHPMYGTRMSFSPKLHTSLTGRIVSRNALARSAATLNQWTTKYTTHRLFSHCY